MITAIIIDDMQEARQLLRADVEDNCPQVKLVGEAEGVVSGAKAIKQLKPDLVFLDIQMEDGTGFDLLEILPEINFKLIFTTASDAWAIKAFRYSAVDYLLKPIDPQELQEAVAKIEEKPQVQQESFDILLDTVKEQVNPKRLALHTLDKIHVVQISDILRCESTGSYTEFFFTTQKKLLVTRTLKEFDKLLADHQFIRVHQSHLVNTLHIREFVKVDGGYIVMNDGSKIPVSTRKKPEVIRMLNAL
ncbi:MAG: LytTR family DNA-binding domain-containing protein [Bacteroidota bacterium]